MPPASALDKQSNGFSATDADAPGLSAKLDSLQLSLQEVRVQMEAARDEAAAHWRAQKAAQEQVEHGLRAECAALQFALVTILNIGRNVLPN